MSQAVSLSPSNYARAAFAHLRQWTPLRRDTAKPWVLVFPKQKVAYIPIPKAANSSIRAALLPLIGLEPAAVQGIQSFTGFQKVRYGQFAKMRQPGWFVFTAVREPYSRYASAYLNKLITREEALRPLRSMGLRKGDSFARYMAMLEMWPPVALNGHFASQAIMLNNAIEDGINVYKMEELAQRWQEVVAEIRKVSGIEIGQIEHRNKGSAKIAWRSLYDDNTKAIARKLGERDFAAFGYSPDFP